MAWRGLAAHLDSNRMHIARNQTAGTAAPLGQQSVAAEQRSISYDEYFAIVQNRFRRGAFSS